jgi:hypothetical protein
MDGVERGNNWHHHCKAAVSDHHVVLQLMAVIAERDAALLEKNTAIAEKMAAWAERDAALLQRDAALADRDSALLKRDAAISALAKVEKESSSCARKRPSSAGGIHGSKLLQRVGFAEHYSLVGEFQPNSVMAFDAQSTWVAGEHLAFQGTRTQTELWRKQSPQVSPGVPAQNKALHLAVKKVESWPSPIQRQLQEYQVKGDEEEGQTRESEIASTASYATMPVSAPTRIPYCSCTGMNQQCYRWGSGGWQSACCTTLLSLHPLPMNPKKRGSRVAGRKMSAGAFDKLLEKLKLEGVDISYSVDLKDHWAKHGTNRYVTLR